MNVELKTTGELIDELITTQLKLSFFGYTEEIVNREFALVTAINKRLTEEQIIEITSVVEDLQRVSKECWDAQDKIMNRFETHDSIAVAAVKAQQLNVERTGLIRKIDKLVNDGGFTRLEKSYA